MARQTHEDGAARQASLKEKQLSEMRRMRKDADEHHQAMLNRIGFLKSEEAKLDRDIEAAKRRALELLSRKAEKAEKLNDDDVVSTAKDIMEAVGPSLAAAKALRPNTGRSSLRSSLASVNSLPSTSTMPVGALSAPPSAPNMSNPRQRSVSAQRSARSSSAGQPLKPTKPSLSSPAAIPTPLASKRIPPSEPSTSGVSGSPRPSAPAGLPPRPDHPLGTPPRPELPVGMPPRSVSNETTRRKSKMVSLPPPTGPPNPLSQGAADSCVGSSSSQGGSAMQQLEAGSSSVEAAAALLSRQQQQRQASLNRMDTLGPGAGCMDAVDSELIEELIAGTSAAERQQQQLQGLQQFNSESATRVVHVKTARSRQHDGALSSAVVMAAGVGWGLAPAVGSAAVTSYGVAVAVEGAERVRLQQELVKKRQLRGVRKAFGLQPSMLQDSSAQVVECGAGSWQ